MKDFKEKMEHFDYSTKGMTKEQIETAQRMLLAYNKQNADKHGISSYFPITLIAELGELITVIGEHIGRPDKFISRFDILDELSDAYGLIKSALIYYGFTEEELDKAVILKLLKAEEDGKIPSHKCEFNKEELTEDGDLPHKSMKEKEAWDIHSDFIAHRFENGV